MAKRKDGRFFKLGAKAHVFWDAASKLKVTRNVPGALRGKMNKHISEKMSNGHIIEIDKDEYEEMLAAHDVNIANNNKLSHYRLKARKGEMTPEDLEKKTRDIMEEVDEFKADRNAKLNKALKEGDNTNDDEDEDDSDDEDEDETPKKKAKAKAKKKAKSKKKKKEEEDDSDESDSDSDTDEDEE